MERPAPAGGGRRVAHDQHQVKFYQALADIGLVRIQLLVPVGTQQPPTVWWVGKAKAEEDVAAGRAVYLPLPEGD
jgi:hypothetical protein